MSCDGSDKHLSSSSEVRMRTDGRDARFLAKAVYWGSYSEVMPLSEEDEAHRDYIRMCDDRNDALKRAK